MDRRILFIGGSPCSGKSTIAEMIANEFGAYYYKVDDHLEEFVGQGADNGSDVCRKVLSRTRDEIWMREPSVQCEEEFCIYSDLAEVIFERLEQLDHDIIVTEGAAFTPEVMKRFAVKERIAIVPTAKFQIDHYVEREWVPYMLAGCSDEKQAFDNWMERDHLFAKEVRRECEKNSIPCIVNDGTKSIEELYDIVKGLFRLN